MRKSLSEVMAAERHVDVTVFYIFHTCSIDTKRVLLRHESRKEPKKILNRQGDIESRIAYLWY